MPEDIHDMTQGWNSLAAELLYAVMLDGTRTEEIAFYERRIRANVGAALEQACGTGCTLFPLLARGLEVHGADVSAEGLNLARMEAKRQKVHATLFHQRMEDCDLPHQYGTIYTNSFQVVADRHQALTTLQRFWQHLIPGGQLLLYLYIPEEVSKGPACNDADHPTRIGPIVRRQAEGEIAATFWSESVDLFEQVALDKRLYELYIDGKCVRSEVHACLQRWYFHYEALMMLERAGFEDLTTYSDYTDHPATQESKTVVYGGRRPCAS